MKKYYIVGRYKDAHYDETQKVVVCATSPHQARLLASTANRDEGKKVWLDPKQSYCHILQADRDDIGVLCTEGLNG